MDIDPDQVDEILVDPRRGTDQANRLELFAAICVLHDVGYRTDGDGPLSGGSRIPREKLLDVLFAAHDQQADGDDDSSA